MTSISYEAQDRQEVVLGAIRLATGLGRACLVDQFCYKSSELTACGRARPYRWRNGGQGAASDTRRGVMAETAPTRGAPANPSRPAEGADQAGPHRCRGASSSPRGAETGPASRRSPNAADIGFGSFYNHFDSKDELFATASAEVLERWGQMIDRACAGIADPAEVFAVSFRISGRLGWTHPAIARFSPAPGWTSWIRPPALRPAPCATSGQGSKPGASPPWTLTSPSARSPAACSASCGSARTTRNG